MQRRLCGSADGAARLRLGASRRSAPTQGNEVGGECAAAPIANPHQRQSRPCPRMTRIHANKTMADKLLYSSLFATIRIIRGQNFRFTSLAPAHVALRAALRQGWFAFLPECLTLRATHVAYRANPRLLGSQPAPAGMCSREPSAHPPVHPAILCQKSALSTTRAFSWRPSHYSKK